MKNIFLKIAAMAEISNFRSEQQAILDLQIIPMLPNKFQVSWLFGSGEEAKNRFSGRRSWWPSWISDRNGFSVFI